jgi:hypothetical protein
VSLIGSARKLVASVIVVGTLFAVTVAAVASLAAPVQHRPPSSETIRPTPNAGVRDWAIREFRGPEFDPDTYHRPSGDKPQSKLWHSHGAWWAVMAASDGQGFSIYRLDWASQDWADTGILVDERPRAKSDVLWDDPHLYVLSGGTRSGAGHAIRLVRFSFDEEEFQFVRDADFPVAITEHGSRSATLARDSRGVLWAAFIHENRVLVANSAGSDHRWSMPRRLPVAGTDVDADEAAVIAYGSNLGVVWSNQNEDAVYFATRADGSPITEWTATRTAVSGLKHADDHINVAALGEGDEARLFVAIKTSLGDLPVRNPRHPQIMLLIREPDGSWSQHLVSRVRDSQTRPIVVLDEVGGTVYVFAAGRDGIYFKASALERISFESGQGRAAITGARLNDPTRLTTPNDPTSRCQE